MIILITIILPLQAQNTKKLSIELKNKPLPAALKLIEKEGGKNIIFSYNETESYRVTASIRQKTELEAIGTVLNGCATREDGSFLMIAEEGIPYLIRVSYIGYKTESMGVQ